MDQLQQARAQIDEIDAKMAALFEQRMQAVGQVAQYKARTGKQVFDPAREALVLEKNTARVQNPELQPYYREFLKKALAVSRAYQHVLIGQDVAAYQGVEGAWSHIALRQLFPFAKAQAYSTWNEVVEAVERGDAYCGVLPFENSNAGDVSAVLDLLYAHPGLKVARMCDLPIRQDLLALPGAQLSEIKTVISHQQALAQSGPFLKLHHFATKAWGNTADAARYVAEQGDQTLAAIASAETAKPCSGLPPAAAAPPWIAFSSHHPSNTGIKTSLAEAAFPPAPSAYLRRRNIGQETARIVQMKKFGKMAISS